MLKFLKDLLIGLGKAMVVMVLVFGLLIGYVGYAKHSATDKAEHFCRSVAMGSDA